MASVPWPPNLALSMQFMQSPDKGSVKIRGGTVGRGRTLQASSRNQDGGMGAAPAHRNLWRRRRCTRHTQSIACVWDHVASVRRELASAGQGPLQAAGGVWTYGLTGIPAPMEERSKRVSAWGPRQRTMGRASGTGVAEASDFAAGGAPTGLLMGKSERRATFLDAMACSSLIRDAHYSFPIPNRILQKKEKNGSRAVLPTDDI